MSVMTRPGDTPTQPTTPTVQPTIDRSTEGPGRSPASSLRDLWRGHGRSILVLALLLVVAGAAHGINMFGNPQVIDDEGTYVAQAWAVVNFGDLAHYTFWYDHPPLGWLQLAGYAQLTAGFDRAGSAVQVGREFMLVTQLVSVVLLWVLCRRLQFARWSAAVAVLVFALSPLAIQFHRTVFLDNIAVMWLLAALALAASPRRRLAELAAAAVAFAVAVLTKETFLLLLPAVAVLILQSTERTTRRYTLAVVASLLLAIGSAYVLLALLKGELLAEPGQVSLMDGLQFQLLDRASGGSVFDPGSANRATLDVWLRLDTIVPVVALIVTPFALAVRRLRAIAVGLAILAVTLLRPGYLPVPLIIGALPFAAVLIGGVADLALRRREVSWLPSWAQLGGPVRGRPLAPLVVALAAVAVVAVPQWVMQLRGLFVYQPNQPVVAAQAWIEDNLTRENRLMVDDAFWVDLVEAGWDRSNVVWAYKVDTDPAVAALSPDGWRDYDYVVVTDSMRRNDSPGENVSLALQNSVPVARFQANGIAETTVEVRRILADGAQSLPDGATVLAEEDLRAEAAAALVENPNITVSGLAQAKLLGGDVDERLLTILAGGAQEWSLNVSAFPVVDGEQDIDTPRRVAVVTSAEPVAGVTSTFRDWLDEQSALALDVTVTEAGTVISVPPGAPGEKQSFTRAATPPTTEEIS